MRVGHKQHRVGPNRRISGSGGRRHGSGSGKSPGADCLMRDVLPEIERRMCADFVDRLWRWRADIEIGKLARERWLKALRDASKRGSSAALPPLGLPPAEPQLPRLRQHDVTIEKVAAL